ncbi:hypothetical protein CC1G_06118 [Coprinopsis cinerea okayama7|uniref:Uncharacterized protein n=1 Tax=Coprinopsis cinerea (strain Okayama-7 / 130 / ATCC MYA-4618 / FGSC 9003) TaxID=240176 RepID=A8PA82_COPC7|nr:hypothetical protein CC1G_06118 [Coprinopsis cinerea okayama7\|eukprot:XP_001839928.2 hypothetical protein CC1G_06118 [Coprinopsis cinerea okayama7\
MSTPTAPTLTRAQALFVCLCSAYLRQALRSGEEEEFMELFYRLYFSRWPIQRQVHRTREAEMSAREETSRKLNLRIHISLGLWPRLTAKSNWKTLAALDYLAPAPAVGISPEPHWSPKTPPTPRYLHINSTVIPYLLDSTS